MKVNNSPSFGMAYKVDTRKFYKFSEAELSKVERVIANSGDALLKATQGVELDISGNKTRSGSHLYLLPTSKDFCLKDYFKMILEIIRKKALYAKKLNIEDLTEEKLVTAAKESSALVLEKFGKSAQIAKRFEKLNRG